MTNQTIEEAVEERFNGSNIFWKVILKNLTPETISFIKYDYTQALQAQRDAGARERKGWKGYAVVDAETDYYLYSDFFVNKKDAVKYWKNEMSETKGLVIIEVDVYPALTPPTK